MNDSDLELRLRALAPAAPSPALKRAVAQELATAHAAATPARGWARPRWWRDAGWALAGAAAVLLAVAFVAPAGRMPSPLAQVPVPVGTAPVVPDDDTFEHTEASQELLAADDSPEVIETAEGPAREVRYSFRERHAWANPRTGARVVIEVPREDIYLLPVSLQ
jgi:hypothetical protein